MFEDSVDIRQYGLEVETFLRNPSTAKLYEEALGHEDGSGIASSGALVAMSGDKTGRSPEDKRIVERESSVDDIWWGDVNIKLDDEVFEINRERAVDYLYGTILENVVCDPTSRIVDFGNSSITENTRASYPIRFIENAKIPCVGGHPENVIFLTCDAFGILPPISRLTPPQALYHFVSGYTAKIPGTEAGIEEPEATFSPCYGAPFLVLPPGRYAELLDEKIEGHGSKVWLVNTGWTGGPYGEGERIDLSHTRAMIDAIHEGSLDDVDYEEDPLFGVSVPLQCPGVPEEILRPRQTWSDTDAYDGKARELVALFEDNFEQYAGMVGEDVKRAAPVQKA